MRSTTRLMMSFMAVFMWHQYLGLRAQELTSGPDLDRIATISELGKLYGELAALNDILLYEMKLVADQKNTEGVKAVFDRKSRDYEPRIAKLMELAVDVGDTSVARDAAILTLTTTYGNERETAIDLLLESHIESHRMDEALTSLVYTSRSTDICRRVLDANDDLSVRAHAEFEIARKTLRDSDDARHNAKEILWKLVKTGENIPFHNGAIWGPNQTRKNISIVAAKVLSQITGNETVKIGGPIPAFKGKSLYGDDVSIHDYKGKVTLIVFWATWCGPCLKMAELEGELVERYAGLPFEILGICGDDEITDQVKKTALTHGISWTSIHDVLPDETRLSERLGAPSWPYCILLDRDGVVQQKQFPTGVTIVPAAHKDIFQAAIEKLLPEYERK
jgi:thiol-disulfide isomerase/thioredoxin